MIQPLVRRLAGFPRIFDLLRWILEGGYRGHRQVIRQELGMPAAAILDVGCGTGIYARYFDPAAYTGVDLNPAYIAAAARKFPGHRFLVMDARQLAFADRSFDVCFISGVLHHLPDEAVRQVLREIARVLRQEGTLIVWEDIPARSAWNLVGRLIHCFDLGRHIRELSEYQALLEQQFRVDRAYFMHSGCMDYGVLRCVRS